MPAHKGNQNWRLRLTHGRENEFTPDELRIECEDYFQWAEENPLIEERPMNTAKGIKMVDVKHKRPFTLEGLCTHIGIVVKTFHNYEKLKEKLEKEVQGGTFKGTKHELEEKKKEVEDFLQVTSHVRQIIYTQKFEGAAAGFFKENLIAASLGIKRKVENTIVTEQPLFPDVKFDEPQRDEED